MINLFYKGITKMKDEEELLPGNLLWKLNCRSSLQFNPDLKELGKKDSSLCLLYHMCMSLKILQKNYENLKKPQVY